MTGFSFDAPMRRGWIGLSLWMLSSSLMQFMREDLSTATKCTLFVALLVNSAAVVYLIRHIRTARHDALAVGLSGWGYAWRGFVAQVLATVLLALIRAFLVPIEYARAAGHFDVGALLFLEVPFLALTAVAIWLLYSHDKMRQARWLLGAVRGF
jgi:hypothetical protein